MTTPLKIRERQQQCLLFSFVPGAIIYKDVQRKLESYETTSTLVFGHFGTPDLGQDSISMPYHHTTARGTQINLTGTIPLRTPVPTPLMTRAQHIQATF
jgi:hypothetical protein